jgi:hypothetical protein
MMTAFASTPLNKWTSNHPFPILSSIQHRMKRPKSSPTPASICSTPTPRRAAPTSLGLKPMLLRLTLALRRLGLPRLSPCQRKDGRVMMLGFFCVGSCDHESVLTWVFDPTKTIAQWNGAFSRVADRLLKVLDLIVKDDGNNNFVEGSQGKNNAYLFSPIPLTHLPWKLPRALPKILMLPKRQIVSLTMKMSKQ